MNTLLNNYYFKCFMLLFFLQRNMIHPKHWWMKVLYKGARNASLASWPHHLPTQNKIYLTKGVIFIYLYLKVVLKCFSTTRCCNTSLLNTVAFTKSSLEVICSYNHSTIHWCAQVMSWTLKQKQKKKFPSRQM